MPEFKRITKANSAFEIAPTTDDADTLLFKATDKNGAVLFQIDTAKGASGTGTTYDLALTGARGDGIQDDTSYIVAALAKAGSTGTVVSPPGKTYLISTITISSDGARLDLAGSTLKKKSTLTSYALEVTGNNVWISNIKIDGNKAGGATGEGIRWSGTGGTLVNSTITNCRSHGIDVTGGLTCRNVTSSSNGNTLGEASGFTAQTAGLISLDLLCVGNNNMQCGVTLNTTATGCHVDGTYNRNALCGLWIFKGNTGTSTLIYADDNDFQNVLANQGVAGIALTDWKFGTIIASNQGATGGITSGASVEFQGCSRFQVGTLITRGGGGYGLALASGDGIGGTGVGTSDCSFGTVICDNTGAADTDAGITFQFGAKRNHIGFASVRGHSWAVTISEETAPLGNDHNSIGTLHATGCPWGIIWCRGGTYNTIGRLVGRDCGNLDPTLTKGLIEWALHPTAGAGVSRGNTIGFFDYKDTRSTSTRPIALVRATSGESGNAVLDGIARDADADVNDENGNNPVTLRPMLRNTSIDTFEAGWTGGADNLTAGQFVEGTKGRRIVSNTGGTAVITHASLSLDLSAMGTDEWFRWFVNVENVSDKHANTPILLRFGTDPTGATNYYQWTVAPDALRVNGPQYLRARKGGFAATGSPNWASIVRIDFFTVSNAANTFAVTYDNLERIYPDRYSTHIGGVLPYGMPVGSGGILISTGKINVNDAGTWKSATAS
jgi:hypothetical protein